MAASRITPPDLLARSGLAALLRQSLPAGAVLWVGFSGGRDSVVLLHLCHALMERGEIAPGLLRAVHVHHGLSAFADEWADFCSACCSAWSIPLEIARVRLPSAAGQGVEAAARQARYQAFRQCGVEHIALAHHRRDQVETLLFNLCRGSGVAGAAAMQPVAQAEGMQVLRPLLDSGAADLAVYAQSHGLRWIEDDSNQNRAYTRNFIRHEVLPVLEQRFPAAELTLARATRHFAEAEGLLEEVAVQDDALVQGRVSVLLTLSDARQANWLRYWLRQAGWQVPGTATLQETLRQIRLLREDACFELCLPEGSLRFWRGRLYRVPKCPEVPAGLVWRGEPRLDWGGGVLSFERAEGAGIKLDRLGEAALHLRPRVGGEVLALGPGRPRRLLKKILQESDVPPWERAQLPLLFAGDELVACPGIGVAAAWQCPAGAAGVVCTWVPVPASSGRSG